MSDSRQSDSESKHAYIVIDMANVGKEPENDEALNVLYSADLNNKAYVINKINDVTMHIDANPNKSVFIFVVGESTLPAYSVEAVLDKVYEKASFIPRSNLVVCNKARNFEFYEEIKSALELVQVDHSAEQEEKVMVWLRDQIDSVKPEFTMEDLLSRLQININRIGNSVSQPASSVFDAIYEGYQDHCVKEDLPFLRATVENINDALESYQELQLLNQRQHKHADYLAPRCGEVLGKLHKSIEKLAASSVEYQDSVWKDRIAGVLLTFVGAIMLASTALVAGTLSASKKTTFNDLPGASLFNAGLFSLRKSSFSHQLEKLAEMITSETDALNEVVKNSPRG